MVTEGDLAWHDEHTIEYIVDVLQNYIPETNYYKGHINKTKGEGGSRVGGGGFGWGGEKMQTTVIEQL